MADQLSMLPAQSSPPSNTPASFAARPPDDFDLIAHEVYGVRADARWIIVDTLGDGSSPRALTSFRLVMAVPPTVVFKTGPRAGTINWRKRDKSLDRELIVSFKDFDAFVAKRKAAR